MLVFSAGDTTCLVVVIETIVQQHLVFGHPLEAALAASSTGEHPPLQDVPAVIRRCIEYIDARGRSTKEVTRFAATITIRLSLNFCFVLF